MLLERDGELTALRAAVRQRGSTLVVVEGPAGVGKTRLLAEAPRDTALRGLAARGGGGSAGGGCGGRPAATPICACSPCAVASWSRGSRSASCASCSRR